MDLQELIEAVDKMAVEHDYPGYDLRRHIFGLTPAIAATNARVFVQALTVNNVLVKLLALRWFQDRSGDAKRHLDVIAPLLKDEDAWVRLETLKTISKVDKTEEPLAVEASELLRDPEVEVRRQAAKTLGKLDKNSEPVLAALKAAFETDKDAEVRGKAQKALRQLGAYS